MSGVYSNPPQSRNEKIIKAIIDGTEYLAPPQSRIEDLLIMLKAAIEEQGTVVDTQMSDSSVNPVQNQAIYHFVNSSVSTNTANFIGTFNSVEALEAYSGTVTNNDYAFVIATDTAGNTVYNRYKYQGASETWAFEYALNNSSFTAEQWATIQSGLTSSDKTQIGTNAQNISDNTAAIALKANSADLGTAAAKDVPASGDAGNNEVVLGNDSRMADARIPLAHNQAANTINAMTGYSKPQATSAITESDTLNQAIGKIEAAIGSKQDTLSTAQLNAINSGINADKVTEYDNNSALYKAALNHNTIFRGRDLTNVYTIDQLAAKVYDGSFDDIYLGDYFTVTINTDIYNRFVGSSFVSGRTYYEASGTINNRTWTATSDTVPQSDKVYATLKQNTESVDLMFAGFDYYYNLGDTATTRHHAVLTLKNMIFDQTAKMYANGINSGYYNSDIHQYILPCYAKSLKVALNNHILSFSSRLTDAVDDTVMAMSGMGLMGSSSNIAWYDTELQLMTDAKICGEAIYASSALDVGVLNRILPVYNYITPITYSRHNMWLASVASSTDFAYYASRGHISHQAATQSIGISPMILFG